MTATTARPEPTEARGSIVRDTGVPGYTVVLEWTTYGTGRQYSVYVATRFGGLTGRRWEQYGFTGTDAWDRARQTANSHWTDIARGGKRP